LPWSNPIVCILEDIEELRTTIKEPEDIGSSKIDFDGDEGDDDSPLFGGNPPLPFKQVITQFLPPRYEVGRLVAAYFRAKAVAAPFFPYTLSTTGRLISEVKLIHQELQYTYAALPIISQASLVANSIANSPSIIVTQLCVNTIYWKCLCLLHLPYVTLTS
jgi:hypothetical protein